MGLYRLNGGCICVYGGMWDFGEVFSVWRHGVWVYGVNAGLIEVNGVCIFLRGGNGVYGSLWGLKGVHRVFGDVSVLGHGVWVYGCV